MPTPRPVLLGALAALLAMLGAAGTAQATDGETDLERHDAERLRAVITKDRPISPIDYEPDDLEPVPGTTFEVRAEVLDQLVLLFEAAEDDGLGLRVISGYRSHDTQAGTYDYWVQHYGRASADATSARPGHSEHQTGLAVDVDSTTGTCYLDPCFGRTAEGRWVAGNAHEFGFILSYPEDLRERTGYAYEPWHLRYVGPLVASDMHQRGIVLLPDYLGAPASSVRIGELLGSVG